MNKEAEREARKRQRRSEQLEQQIAVLESERSVITLALSGQETDPKRIAELATRYSSLERDLQTLYDEWAIVNA